MLCACRRLVCGNAARHRHLVLDLQASRPAFVVDDLYVCRFPRAGLGRSLLAHLAAKAWAAGGFLEWQVLDWNAPSIAFYKSLGAKPVDEWLNYRLDGEGLERLAS